MNRAATLALAKRGATRKGLHRMTCWSCEDAGSVAYATVSTIERGHGPRCHCGEALIPDRFDLASYVMSADDLPMHPEYAAFIAECVRVERGQRGHVRNPDLLPVETVAAARVTAARKVAARAAQTAALMPTPVPADIPF